jgi:hypothetical protein
MPIGINGSGTITGLSAGGLPDGSVTSDDLAAGSVIASKIGYAGAILQIVQTVKTDTFSQAGSTFGDITGMSASITPSSASNRVFVFVDLNVGSSGNIAQLQLYRGATLIYVGDAAGSRRQVFAAAYDSDPNTLTKATVMFLDSPATTSSVTYKLQGATDSAGTFFINRTSNDTNSITGTRGASTITLMEVKV